MFTRQFAARSVLFPLVLTAAAVAVGCGSAAQNQFIKSFGYNLDAKTVDVLSEFSTEVSLNVEVDAPIKNFGYVRFIPADSTHGFQIRTTIDMSAYLDTDLLFKKTSVLPNGRPFPSYITSDLATWNFKNADKYNANLYLGLQPEKRFLGAGIELKFIDAQFPEGLSVSQRILDANKNELGVVTLYGPKLKDGKVEIPGGLFIATDLSKLKLLKGKTLVSVASAAKASSALTPYDGFDVDSSNPADAREFKKPEKLLNLFKMFRSKGQDSGLME